MEKTQIWHFSHRTIGDSLASHPPGKKSTWSRSNKAKMRCAVLFPVGVHRICKEDTRRTPGFLRTLFRVKCSPFKTRIGTLIILGPVLSFFEIMFFLNLWGKTHQEKKKKTTPANKKSLSKKLAKSQVVAKIGPLCCCYPVFPFSSSGMTRSSGKTPPRSSCRSTRKKDRNSK